MAAPPAKLLEAAPRGAWYWIAVACGVEAALLFYLSLASYRPWAGLLSSVVTLIVILLGWAARGARRQRRGPGDRALLAVVFLIAAAVWLLSHVYGWPWLPGGLRAETAGVPEFYLLALELVAALLFACLALAAWPRAPGAVRIAAKWAPTVLLLAGLVWIVATLRSTQLILAILVLDAAPQLSLPFIFAPIAVLLLGFVLARLVSPKLRARTPGGTGVALALIPVAFLLTLTGWGGAISATQAGWFSRDTRIVLMPDDSKTFAYCWPGGSPLAMDYWRPLSMEPAPVVVFIHGGETMLGSRVLNDGGADGRHFERLRAALLAKGIGFASIDYRLAPIAHVGAQVDDAKCAIRFLRAHARGLGVDPARIGVMGPSQGGYLSSMVGLTGPADGYETGEWAGQSSAVQAVADLWGPADLNDWSGSPKWVVALVRGPKAGLAAASPVSHAHAGAPPFLILQGADDWFVAPHHSQLLSQRLQQAGVSVQFIQIRNDGHGLAAGTKGKAQQPAPEELTRIITDFFAAKLGPAAGRPSETR